MNAVQLIATCTFCVCSLASCSWTADLQDVPGTYVMNHGVARDTLVVRSDSTYQRTYLRPGAVAVIDRGRWGTSHIERDTYVSFDSFPVRWRTETSPNEQPVAGVWPVIPERTITGKLKLVVDADLGWAYVQVTRP